MVLNIGIMMVEDTIIDSYSIKFTIGKKNNKICNIIFYCNIMEKY